MYLKINTTEELLRLIEELLSSSITWIAVDTEFERRDTYFPMLSLLQLATENKAWVIDALSGIDFTPLEKIFENPKILKVWHAGDQDFDAIRYKFNLSVHPFIDTQVMATFASMGKALSLEKLAMHFFNIQIDKTLQNSKWLNRPLSEKQIAYAANDAKYIAKIYPILKTKLSELKRLDWVIDEMQTLFEKYSNPNTSKEWLKFCNPKQNYITYLFAYVLVNWREKIAKANNTAKPKVIPNHLMEYMVESKKHKNYTEKLCPAAYLKDFLDTWESIKETLQNTEIKAKIEKEIQEHFAKIPPNEADMLSNINQKLQNLANELNLPADTLLNKQQKLMALKTKGDSLTGWRKQIFESLFID